MLTSAGVNASFAFPKPRAVLSRLPDALKEGIRVVNLTTGKSGIIRFGVSTLALTLATAALADSGTHANGDTRISAETFRLAASGEADLAALPADENAALTLQSQDPAPTTASSPAPPEPKPVDLRIVASQFVDVPVSGDARSIVRYSGRVDGYLEVRGNAIGGSSNLTFKIRPEYTWGKTSNGEIGLIPGKHVVIPSRRQRRFRPLSQRRISLGFGCHA